MLAPQRAPGASRGSASWISPQRGEHVGAVTARLQRVVGQPRLRLGRRIPAFVDEQVELAPRPRRIDEIEAGGIRVARAGRRRRARQRRDSAAAACSTWHREH